MGEFGNAVKYLYQQFILRDVLSFVTPGAMVVFTALFLVYPQLLSYSIHWLLYIPLFGVFYMVGFAVQCLGELFGVIHFSPPDKYPWPLSQRLNIFWSDWTRDKDEIWWVKYYKEVEKFYRANTDEGARQARERLIVLKQMCANGSLALLIAGVLLAFSFCPLSWVRLAVISLVTLVFLVSLFWGHRVHVLRQYAREKVLSKSA